MRIDASKYINSLRVRIQNLYIRNKWRREAYCQMLKFSDELDLIVDDYTNKKDVTRSMLALNRKLITQEGSGRTRKYPRRSAQRQAMRMR